MDVFSLILSLLGFYGIVFSLRLLLPRNFVPRVLAVLNEAMALLERDEAIYIPNLGDYRAKLAMCAHTWTLKVLYRAPLTEHRFRSQFIQMRAWMRAESNHSPGFLQQLCLLFLSGLTWRLYSLKSRIQAVKREVEVCRTLFLPIP
jgi:hypothetical protein